jgi:hypothetical protein
MRVLDKQKHMIPSRRIILEVKKYVLPESGVKLPNIDYPIATKTFLSLHLLSDFATIIINYNFSVSP